MGYIASIIAGAIMSIQGVVNTRLSEKTGLLLSNAYVQFTAFIFSLIALIFAKKINFSSFGDVNKFYLTGGALGLIITLTVMIGVKRLSPTVSISPILISQLLCASLIDAFGLWGSEKVLFLWNKYIGLLLMIGGVILFKMDFS